MDTQGFTTTLEWLQDQAVHLSKEAARAFYLMLAEAERLLDLTRPIVAQSINDLQALWLGLWEEHRLLASVVLLGVLLVCILLLRQGRRGGQANDRDVSLSRYAAAPRRIGWAAVGVLVAGLAAMGFAAPIAGAVIATGVVSPDGERKQVQHLEGGIVQTILVREGDLVVEGQPLVVMDATRAATELNELRERFVHFKGVEARLIAEQSNQPLLVLEEDIAGIATDLDFRKVLDAQTNLLVSRAATHESREKVLGQRVLQLREENLGIQDLLKSQAKQMELILQEGKMVQTLLDKGYERLPRILALQRAQAELEGSMASNRAGIAKNEQAIGQSEMELLTIRQERSENIDEELSTVKAELSSIRSRLPALQDVMKRTTVLAPTSGTVMHVRVNTSTGVIRAGDVFMDIVPDHARLIVDAKVKPIDIDNIHAGMSAKVMLSAFTQRTLPQVFGVVRSVSADRLQDERTGEAYFLAKVEVSQEELDQLGSEHQLISGMPAEVYLLTQERTALDYLITPFIQSITRSFREV